MRTRAAVLLLAALLLSGCWSRRELNDLAIAVGLGVDRGAEKRLRVTVVFATPESASTQKGGGGGGGGGGAPGGRKRLILQGEGDTMTEALRQAELAAPRRLVLDHTQVVVLGERLAAQGLDTTMDHMLRNVHIRLDTPIVALKGAEVPELLQLEPLMGTLQAHALREIQERRPGLMVTLNEFFLSRSLPYRAIYLPAIDIRRHPTGEPGAPDFEAEMGGAVVFQGDRAALWLDRTAMNSIQWLQGHARDTVVTVPCPDLPEHAISGEIARERRSITPIWNGSQLRFDVTITAEIHITDLQCHLNLAEPQSLATVQKALTRDVAKRVSSLISQVQAVPADPFEFGERVRAKLPALWDRIGDRWPQVWADTPVTVTAWLKVIHLEMTTEPPQVRR